MALHGAACRSNRSGWGDMLALGNVATWRQGSTWFHVRICFVSNFQGMRWRYGQIFFAVKSQTTWKPRRKAEYRIQIAAQHGARGNCTNPNTNTTVRIYTYIYIYTDIRTVFFAAQICKGGHVYYISLICIYDMYILCPLYIYFTSIIHLVHTNYISIIYLYLYLLYIYLC
jgi:hypothetical protein